VPPVVRRGAARRLVLAFGVVAVLGALVPVAPVAAATDRLPDLRAAYIRDLRIVRSDGRRLLRFTGMMYNTGAGPLDVRARRASRSSPWDVDQLIYDTDGGSRRVDTAAGMRYAGDGHDHWHVRRMMTYHLWGGPGTARDAKIGFCFFDTNLIDGALPRSPSRAVYLQSMCGKRASLSTRNGISVGWGDKYPYHFAFQWIDITGMPGGTYTLRVAVDMFGYFTEQSDTNNCAWAKVRFGASGSTVTVLDRGKTCINDYATSPYAADIAWAREAGVSNGCGGDMFCTNNPMTRGEAAGFISRGFQYPAASRDYFSDDTGNANETYINRIAEAGLTHGCDPGKFCPNKRTTQGQVARLLSRALALPPATQDYYDDDNGTTFEDDLNRLAEAGISSGCGVRRSCPSNVVTRGQMVAMLHRALAP
jgi:hypothetical protein